MNVTAYNQKEGVGGANKPATNLINETDILTITDQSWDPSVTVTFPFFLICFPGRKSGGD